MKLIKDYIESDNDSVFVIPNLEIEKEEEIDLVD